MPHPATPATSTSQRWDLFCQVIDNFGDIGVCWRLAAELGARGHNVRLYVDDASALQWMAPAGATNVQVLDYRSPWPDNSPPHFIIEAFGCEAPAPYLQALAAHHAQAQRNGSTHPVLINLEYLSAESYVERCHRLPSPILNGPGTGLTRWFFYPGFTAQTGGLIAEQALAQRQAQFDRNAWRAQHGVDEQACAISLFCYEPAALPQLLAQISSDSALHKPQLLVTPGRASAAVQACQPMPNNHIHYLEARRQTAFDELLWACDVNLVRGEDSLVRALWAGQPFVWHIYPQDDNAHHAKLHAFLDWLQAPPSLRAFHDAWNGITAPETLPILTPELLHAWAQCSAQAKARLQTQADLIAQLQQFVAEKS